MITYNQNVKLIGIDSTCTDGIEKKISLYFNTDKCDSSISPKSIFDILFMLNGFFNADEIMENDAGHKDINTKVIVDEFLHRGLILNTESTNERFEYARKNLCRFTVHFTDISNENVMIAVLLHKFDVKCVFYNDGIVCEDDIDQNIYYKNTDLNKNISSVLQKRIGIETLVFSNYPFDESLLSDEKDIIINSNPSNWHDSERCIVINTWNYRNTIYENFNLFNNKTDVSEDLRMLVDKFILATRSIEDVIYSLKGNVAVV